MKKHILITGVSAGIGKATAQHFLQQGWHVWGSVRNVADAADFEKNYPESFTTLVFDLTDDAAIAEAKKQVVGTLGETGLHALINNAGIALPGPLLHLPIADFINQQNINVVGILRVTQAFAPMLKAEAATGKKPGRVVNISSLSGLISRPFMGAYSASKHALESITDTLRRELMLYAIDVIAIEPGNAKTEILAKAKSEKPTYQDTDYAPMLRNLNQQLDRMQAEAIPVEKVVAAIHQAIFSATPKTRYLVAAKKHFIWFVINFLSDRKLDKMFYKSLKDLAANKTVTHK